MQKIPKIFLTHILECITEIESHLRGLSEAEFIIDTKSQDAVIRRIEIIGEAATNLPDDFKRKNSQIEWDEIIGMRNKLIHEYFGVDLDLVWQVAKNDIPKLKKEIQKLL